MSTKFQSREEARDFLSMKFESANRAFDRKAVRDETLLSDAGLDSLDLNAVLLELEEECGVRFADDELDMIETFGQLIDSVVTKQTA